MFGIQAPLKKYIHRKRKKGEEPTAVKGTNEGGGFLTTSTGEERRSGKPTDPDKKRVVRKGQLRAMGDGRGLPVWTKRGKVLLFVPKRGRIHQA